MADVLCVIAALLAAKALLWVVLISLAHWIAFSDILDK